MKTCRKCGENKTEDMFYHKGIRLDGKPKLSYRCKACDKEAKRVRYKPLQKWIRDLRSNFDISPFEYYYLYDKQGGRCAICHTDDQAFSRGNKLHTDHCHTTGKVRGLLCGRCNVAIGHLQDDPNILHRAIDYLS